MYFTVIIVASHSSVGIPFRYLAHFSTCFFRKIMFFIKKSNCFLLLLNLIFKTPINRAFQSVQKVFISKYKLYSTTLKKRKYKLKVHTSSYHFTKTLFNFESIKSKHTLYKMTFQFSKYKHKVLALQNDF